MSVLEACQGKTRLWFPSALRPTNAPFIRILCSSGEVSGNFFFISDIADRACSVQLLSDREVSLSIHTDVPSSYRPADGRQISEVLVFTVLKSVSSNGSVHRESSSFISRYVVCD